jgi:hypothetical protein
MWEAVSDATVKVGGHPPKVPGRRASTDARRATADGRRATGMAHFKTGLQSQVAVGHRLPHSRGTMGTVAKPVHGVTTSTCRDLLSQQWVAVSV